MSDSVILKIIEILRNYSDENHILKEKDLKDYLLKDNIEVLNRKTIYRYINEINNCGYRVIYDASLKGYYLDQSPFSRSEIKILSDSINAHKELDTDDINNKLLSFISVYDRDLITNNQLVIKRNNKAIREKKVGYFSSYSLKIEKILEAISKKLKLEIYHNKKYKIIEPYFLNFSNNKYYIHDSNLYSYRVDRIDYLKVIDEDYIYDEKIKEKIIKKIKTSLDNFDRNDSKIIYLKAKNYEDIKNRLKDDFVNHYLDNNHNIIVEYKPNEIFFAKIVGYNGNLMIDGPLEVKEEFVRYLNNILKDY